MDRARLRDLAPHLAISEINMMMYWDLKTVIEGIEGNSRDLYRKGRHSPNEVLTIYVTKPHIRYDVPRCRGTFRELHA